MFLLEETKEKGGKVLEWKLTCIRRDPILEWMRYVNSMCDAGRARRWCEDCVWWRGSAPSEWPTVPCRSRLPESIKKTIKEINLLYAQSLYGPLFIFVVSFGQMTSFVCGPTACILMSVYVYTHCVYINVAGDAVWK